MWQDELVLVAVSFVPRSHAIDVDCFEAVQENAVFESPSMFPLSFLDIKGLLSIFSGWS